MIQSENLSPYHPVCFTRCCRVLCSTIREFVAKVASFKEETYDPMTSKCCILIQKLDALLDALKQEAPKEPDFVSSLNTVLPDVPMTVHMISDVQHR